MNKGAEPETKFSHSKIPAQNIMSTATTSLAILAACALATTAFSESSVKDTSGSSRLAAGAIQTARLGDIPPLPRLQNLGRGVFIRPLAEVAEVGLGSFNVLPRISHINITVDGTARHEMVVLFSLAPGPHKVLVELSDSSQKIISSETVEFTLPDTGQVIEAEASPASEEAN
jgi:hypothetical protein